MNGWRHYLGVSISSIYGTWHKYASPPRGFRILIYHAVGSTVPGDVRGLYNMAPDRFKQHMDLLSEIALGQVARLNEMPEQGVAVTFDDGYRDNLECAVPILVNHSIPFTVFVTPSFVLSGHSLYLSIAGLRELASVPGSSIGAHGQSHCRLTDCNTNQLREELTKSRKWLEDTLGRPVTTMSYPHGAVNRHVRNEAAAAGYKIAASSRFGTNLPDFDPYWLARTVIWTQDDDRSFRAKLAGDWDWLRCHS